MDENEKKEFDAANEPEDRDVNVPDGTDPVPEELPAVPEKEKDDINEETPKSKKGIIITIVIALIAIAAVAIFLLCFGKGDKNGTSDDSSDVTAASVETVGKDTGDDVTDGTDTAAPVTDDNGNAVTDEKGNVVTDKPASDSTKTASDDDVDEPIDTYVDPVPEVIVEKSTDKSLWPTDALPSGIPACKYISIDNSTKTVDDGIIIWDVSWTTTEEDYDTWIRAFPLNDFRPSKHYGNYFANGKCVVAVSTETDGDNVWVDMMIEQSDPIDYESKVLDGEYPKFKTGDATLEYWVERADSGTVRVQYACASDWQVLVAAYKTDLRNAGFTADETHAYKDVAGVTYSVYYDGDMIKSPESLLYVVG